MASSGSSGSASGQRGARDGKRLLAAGINPLQQMISSCSGAIITSLFVTPLDVVKIRLQAQQKPFPKGGCFIYHNGLMDHLCVCSYCTNGNGNGSSVSTSPKTWYRRPGHFTGTMDAFIKITKFEGVTSLWSGLPPTLAMAVPATVVYFTCYDQLKYALGYQETNPKTKHIPIIAGSIARTAAATLISPLELVRTKMQSQQLSYSELRQAIKTTVQQGGILSLMEGLGPTLLRDVPFSALYWFGYELVKSHQLRIHGSDRLTFVQSFFSGAISGSIAALLTLPFDVVKTHRQIELGEAEMFHKKRVTSTWSIIRRLYKQNGIPSLYAGIVPRLVKIAPACAIMISTYEYGKTFFRTYNESHGALNS